MPSAAVHKPPSKWTVAAAFILAVALHAGAVVWAEMQEAKPPLEVAASSMEKVHSEAGDGTSTVGATGAKIAAD